MLRSLLALFLIAGFISCTTATDSESESSAEAAMEESVEEMPEVDPLEGVTEAPEVVEPKSLLYSVDKIETNEAGYIYVNYTSPDGKVVIDTEEVDPTSYWLNITRNSETHAVPDLYVSPSEVRWSKDSRYVALNNEDYYAGSGATSISIVDVVSKKYMDIACSEFVGDIDVGARSSFSVTDMSWKSHQLIFSVSVNYLGGSGHPGIDENRKSELGENFEKYDPIELGSFIIDMDQEL